MFILIVRNMNDLFGHSGKEINNDTKTIYNLVTLTTITGYLNTMILTKNHNYHHLYLMLNQMNLYYCFYFINIYLISYSYLFKFN